MTYDTAAAENYEESLNSSGSTNDPRETNKEDDTEDILDTRQKDADKGAHTCATRSTSRWW